MQIDESNGLVCGGSAEVARRWFRLESDNGVT